MPLQYYIIPNVITSGTDNYMAVTTNKRTYTIDNVYEQITYEESTVTKAESLALCEEIEKGIIRFVSDGNSVVTPLINISAQIVGFFNSEDDRFDAIRHQVKLRVHPSLRLRTAESSISVEKVGAKERLPVLLHYEDNSTESKDSVATANVGRITGSFLKFNEKETKQDVFFINTADNSKTKVAGKLIFMNPVLKKEASGWR